MYRYAMEFLKEWKAREGRKPLVLEGARQVGKTWLLKEFGRTEFENVAYVRMEDNEAMARLFEGSLDPRSLLQGISLYTGQTINPQTTLVVLDEIQAVPRALTALKYFNEDAPEYAIAVAGSMLGVAMHAGISFPVGKVEFHRLYPMSFREFLLATGNNRYVDLIDRCDFGMMSTFRERFAEQLKLYYYVGGMPEVVEVYRTTGDFDRVRQLQKNILESYENDFSKHASKADAERARLIFNSIPRQLAKETKRFSYGVVKKNLRGREAEPVIRFLVDAGLVTVVDKVSAPGMPLAAYQNETGFKVFTLDIGLLCAQADLDRRTLLEGSSIFTHFKGSLTEQYVCQQLVSDCGLKPYYWLSDKNTSEIDFLYQFDGEVVPVEVKAEENLRAKSLALFCKKYGLENAIRLSLADYREESWMTNVPLYAVSALTHLPARGGSARM
jgi:hypothetical protein